MEIQRNPLLRFFHNTKYFVKTRVKRSYKPKVRGQSFFTFYFSPMLNLEIYYAVNVYYLKLELQDKVCALTV